MMIVNLRAAVLLLALFCALGSALPLPVWHPHEGASVPVVRDAVAVHPSPVTCSLDPALASCKTPTCDPLQHTLLPAGVGVKISVVETSSQGYEIQPADALIHTADVNGTLQICVCVQPTALFGFTVQADFAATDNSSACTYLLDVTPTVSFPENVNIVPSAVGITTPDQYLNVTREYNALLGGWQLFITFVELTIDAAFLALPNVALNDPTVIGLKELYLEGDTLLLNASIHVPGVNVFVHTRLLQLAQAGNIITSALFNPVVPPDGQPGVDGAPSGNISVVTNQLIPLDSAVTAPFNTAGAQGQTGGAAPIPANGVSYNVVNMHSHCAPPVSNLRGCIYGYFHYNGPDYRGQCRNGKYDEIMPGSTMACPSSGASAEAAAAPGNGGAAGFVDLTIGDPGSCAYISSRISVAGGPAGPPGMGRDGGAAGWAIELDGSLVQATHCRCWASGGNPPNHYGAATYYNPQTCDQPGYMCPVATPGAPSPPSPTGLDGASGNLTCADNLIVPVTSNQVAPIALMLMDHLMARDPRTMPGDLALIDYYARALATQPDEPWAIGALAQMKYIQGCWQMGLDWMGNAQTFAPQLSLMVNFNLMEAQLERSIAINSLMVQMLNDPAQRSVQNLTQGIVLQRDKFSRLSDLLSQLVTHLQELRFACVDLQRRIEQLKLDIVRKEQELVAAAERDKEKAEHLPKWKQYLKEIGTVGAVVSVALPGPWSVIGATASAIMLDVANSNNVEDFVKGLPSVIDTAVNTKSRDGSLEKAWEGLLNASKAVAHTDWLKWDTAKWGVTNITADLKPAQDLYNKVSGALKDSSMPNGQLSARMQQIMASSPELQQLAAQAADLDRQLSALMTDVQRTNDAISATGTELQIITAQIAQMLYALEQAREEIIPDQTVHLIDAIRRSAERDAMAFQYYFTRSFILRTLTPPAGPLLSLVLRQVAMLEPAQQIIAVRQVLAHQAMALASQIEQGQLKLESRSVDVYFEADDAFLKALNGDGEAVLYVAPMLGLPPGLQQQYIALSDKDEISIQTTVDTSSHTGENFSRRRAPTKSPRRCDSASEQCLDGTVLKSRTTDPAAGPASFEMTIEAVGDGIVKSGGKRFPFSVDPPIAVYHMNFISNKQETKTAVAQIRDLIAYLISAISDKPPPNMDSILVFEPTPVWRPYRFVRDPGPNITSIMISIPYVGVPVPSGRECDLLVQTALANDPANGVDIGATVTVSSTDLNNDASGQGPFFLRMFACSQSVTLEAAAVVDGAAFAYWNVARYGQRPRQVYSLTLPLGLTDHYTVTAVYEATTK